MLRFFKDHWLGNKWPCIEFEPVEQRYFLPVLHYLLQQYHLPPPHIIDTIDGYAADLMLLDAYTTIQIDTWTFSIAFEKEEARDQVFDDLCSLGAAFFTMTDQ